MISQPLPSHDQAHEYLRKAREKGRLSHAYLLVGAPGTGKTRLCLDFARTLFCENGARGGCDCRQCRSIEHGNHPGVTEYGPPEGKKIIDIDTIREVSERSHYRRDHTFIAIIEGAERMSNPAMNAILKTLEEPAGDFIIMLTAASTGNLLPTVVSRCQPMPATLTRAARRSTPAMPKRMTTTTGAEAGAGAGAGAITVTAVDRATLPDRPGYVSTGAARRPPTG